ncbi:MAG: lutR 1 [Paenibacillus sp.]|nr:lutR 1 [Paenibacillus sp.]
MTIQKEILSEKVAHYLRNRILRGEYEQGFHLSETLLSKELAVSRGPIREAMLLLEHEGLTETFANGRTLVKGYSPQDVRDLFQVRLMLESQAIRSLISQSRHHQLPAEEEQRLAEDTSDSRKEAIQRDIAFHYRIVELSGNRTLINLWTTLRGLIAALIEITTGTYYDLTFVYRCHADIAEALQAGDADSAIEQLERHIRLGEQIIINYMEGQQAQASPVEDE